MSSLVIKSLHVCKSETNAGEWTHKMNVWLGPNWKTAWNADLANLSIFAFT